MPGGSLNQAKRRSVIDGNNTFASATVTLGGTGNVPIFTLTREEPTRDELIKELARKRTLDITVPEKVDEMVTPIIAMREDIIDKVKSLNGNNATAILEAIEAAIPVKIAKKVTKVMLGELLFKMHGAIDRYINAAEDEGSRTLRGINSLFEKLDSAMKSAVSNFMSDQLTSHKSCFPTQTHTQKSRQYCIDGYKPFDTVNQTCIGCQHPYIDEPNTNTSLQGDHLKSLREFEARKKEAKTAATKSGSKAKNITAPKLAQPIRQCHCHQFRCLSNTSDTGTSCPIKCIDRINLVMIT